MKVAFFVAMVQSTIPNASEATADAGRDPVKKVFAAGDVRVTKGAVLSTVTGAESLTLFLRAWVAVTLTVCESSATFFVFHTDEAMGTASTA